MEIVVHLARSIRGSPSRQCRPRYYAYSTTKAPDKGEVGGSSPPRPTKTPQYLCRYFEFCRPSHSPSKSCLPKICQKSGQGHPDARKMFRAFFVAAGAKRKTRELSVRSLCATARSPDPQVRYKPQSPLKLEYIRQENGTPQIARFSAKWITSALRVTRDKRRSRVPRTPGPDSRTVEGRPNRIRSTQSNSGKQDS
jgi:hypothetical protein